MRIVAGSLRGRAFLQPKYAGTRPMGEKVRAALFDIVGPVQDSCVLDVYAGSGALGFEAISRGATLVDAIENQHSVAKTIEKSCLSLGIQSSYHLNLTRLESWLDWPQNLPPKPRYDLIMADPPYTQLNPSLLSKLAGFLKRPGIIVVSHSSRLSPPKLESLKLLDSRKYGDSSLSFYAH